MVEVKHNEPLRGYNTFIPAHQVEQVYYLSYPCKKLSVWWVVHKVNPRKWLYTPGDAGYHDTLPLELLASFVIDPSAGLDDLVGDADDIHMSIVKQKRKPTKKKFRLPRLRSRLPDRDADEF
jgi:hypothetical protein